MKRRVVLVAVIEELNMIRRSDRLQQTLEKQTAKTRRKWYLVQVPVRECRVSFQDSHGVQHSVTVRASSVLEAAGLGLKHVREQEMLDDDSGFREITVEICTRTLRTVPMSKLREWRDANGGSPREMSRKANTR